MCTYTKKCEHESIFFCPFTESLLRLIIRNPEGCLMRSAAIFPRPAVDIHTSPAWDGNEQSASVLQAAEQMTCDCNMYLKFALRNFYSEPTGRGKKWILNARVSACTHPRSLTRTQNLERMREGKRTNRGASASLLIISHGNGGDLVWEAVLYFCEVICICADLHTAGATGSLRHGPPGLFWPAFFPRGPC